MIGIDTCVCVSMLADDNDRWSAGLRQDDVGADDDETVSVQALQHRRHRHADRQDASDGTAAA